MDLKRNNQQLEEEQIKQQQEHQQEEEQKKKKSVEEFLESHQHQILADEEMSETVKGFNKDHWRTLHW